MHTPKLLALAALCALSCLAPAMARAQATLVTGLGGPLDFGTDSPPRGDDDTMPTALSLSATFPGGIDLYGAHYNDVFVNINGSLTFGAGLVSFSPERFPRGPGGVPMVAGWWANADTRPVPPGQPDRNQIYFASTFEHFVVTWVDVGYFDQHIDLVNAFQIILSPSASGVAGAVDVEFRYNRCEWTTGDDAASGGTNGLGGMAAQAGFDQGDGVHYALLPGSGTSAMLSLCTMTDGSGSGGGGDTGAWGITIGGPAQCGNGFLELGEECDDGNTQDHDLCDDFCRIRTACWGVYPDGGIDDPFPDAMFPDDVGPCELPDTGVVDEDAFVVDEDAFVVEEDAFVRPDSGRRPDAGTRFDAGHGDANIGRDTGVGPNQLDVTGGGCGCHAGGARTSRGARALAPLLILALALLRRMRRARPLDA